MTRLSCECHYGTKGLFWLFVAHFDKAFAAPKSSGSQSYDGPTLSKCSAGWKRITTSCVQKEKREGNPAPPLIEQRRQGNQRRLGCSERGHIGIDRHEPVFAPCLNAVTGIVDGSDIRSHCVIKKVG